MSGFCAGEMPRAHKNSRCPTCPAPENRSVQGKKVPQTHLCVSLYIMTKDEVTWRALGGRSRPTVKAASTQHVESIPVICISLQNPSLQMTQAPKNPTGAILWLHDHGETNPSEFATIAQSHVPYLNIHCPAAQLNQFGHATKPTYSWFAVDAKVIKHETTTRPEGLSDSVKYVHERLDHLRSVLSIESDRIIVGGFGHGGALAIAAALAYRSKLAGVLCHSGYVAEPRNELAHLLTNHSTVPNLSAPFMLIHGHEDETSRTRPRRWLHRCCVQSAASRSSSACLRRSRTRCCHRCSGCSSTFSASPSR